MATTVAIPTVTLGANKLQTFGPWNRPAGVTSADAVFDRTIANGLNSLAPTDRVTWEWFMSNDGGVTWIQLGGAVVGGGIITSADDGDGPMATFEIGVSGIPNLTDTTQFELQATATARVAVSGTLTLS